ncbi:hypothetical protein ACUNWD_18240 [Sunxiuqinia sp. A32]|uniref:hypothetical protein n=1 Tax=Sunxiuqinia sp. A32 TaxID=3461496 RepID=UPI0040451C9C
MKRKFTRTFFALLVFSLSLSCSGPKNIIKLEPENENGKWLYGQNFVSDSLYGIIYEVGFDKQMDNKYWFDFNIVNRSNMPVLIDPAEFYCEAYDAAQNPLTPEKIAAIDPEEEIFELEKELSRNEARQKNQLGLTLFAAGIDIATGIATATDDNPHNNHNRTHLLYDVQGAKIENEFEEQSLSQLVDSWKSSTIRKTTLESMYSMQGRVFFPSFPEASYIKIILPVDEDFIEFGFKQVQYPVKP